MNLYIGMSTSTRLKRTELGLVNPGLIGVTALVDTGAGRSHISLDRLESLGVEAIGTERVFTASTGSNPIEMNVYVVDLTFSGDRPGLLARDLEVLGTSNLEGLKVDMLLGRDFLSRCLLVFDGPNRRCSLAYDEPT